MRGETHSVLKRCLEYGAAPLQIYDCILPLHYGTRDVTSNVHSTHRGIGIDEALSRVDQADLAKARDMVSGFGFDVTMGVVPGNDGRGMQLKTYYHKRVAEFDDRIRQMHDLFRVSHEHMRRGTPSERYGEGLKLDGDTLNYPECCSDSYSDNYAADAAKLADLQLLGEGRIILLQDLPDLAAKRKADGHLNALAGSRKITDSNAGRIARCTAPDKLFSFFTRSFYPCTTECDKANAIGRKIYGELGADDPRLASIYKDIFMPYVLYMLQKYSEWKIDISDDTFDMVSNEDIYRSIEGFSDCPELGRAVEKVYEEVRRMIEVQRIGRQQEMMTRYRLHDGDGDGPSIAIPGGSVIFVPSSGIHGSGSPPIITRGSGSSADGSHGRRRRKRGIVYPRGRKKRKR